eukprot:8302154-Pyramimonas_sp.AAC.1
MAGQMLQALSDMSFVGEGRGLDIGQQTRDARSNPKVLERRAQLKQEKRRAPNDAPVSILSVPINSDEASQ